jgi:hypothetical protein
MKKNWSNIEKFNEKSDRSSADYLSINCMIDDSRLNMVMMKVLV